jgi:hypothetical protein
MIFPAIARKGVEDRTGTTRSQPRSEGVGWGTMIQWRSQKENAAGERTKIGRDAEVEPLEWNLVEKVIRKAERS